MRTISVFSVKKSVYELFTNHLRNANVIHLFVNTLHNLGHKHILVLVFAQISKFFVLFFFLECSNYICIHGLGRAKTDSERHYRYEGPCLATDKNPEALLSQGPSLSPFSPRGFL